MCGIAGINLVPAEGVAAREMMRRLLLAIEPRGREATGVAVPDPERGRIIVRKAATAATEFIAGDHLRIVEGAKSVICHTRLATKGSPRNAANNHPIAVARGRVVGVHNGRVANDDELFAALAAPRAGQVDSEAIFAAIAAARGEDEILQALGNVAGTAAVAWFDSEDAISGTLHLARLKWSPLSVAQTSEGSFLFASTVEALHRAARGAAEVSWVREVPEGTYLTVSGGSVERWRRFVPGVPLPASSASTRGGQRWPSSSGSKHRPGLAAVQLRRLTRQTGDMW